MSNREQSSSVSLLDNLSTQVQHNCNISDANHAGDYTLCVYLLKMREYFRWDQALEFSDSLDNNSMTQWLRNREEVWDEVVDLPFQPLTIEDRPYDMFDHQPINHLLHDHSLYYHAGLGQKSAAHFFLADQLERYKIGDTTITVTGHEYARDLTSPPAMSVGDQIILRRESLLRMCWERYQEWNWNRPDNAMKKALSYYVFDEDISTALETMVDTVQDIVLHHELGENRINSQIDSTTWSRLIDRLAGTRAELLARSARDNLADCLNTLPGLLEQQDEKKIHFFFANLTHLRRQLLPMLANAYQQWADGSSIKQLEMAINANMSHWQQLVDEILAIYRQSEQNPASQLVELIESSAL